MVMKSVESNIIHLHPTLKCNLKCKHCYSSSAPSFSDSIKLDHAKIFLEQAYDIGFNTIALSGGEPFLYRNINELLRFTKEIGYKNTVATNGMLLKTRIASESFQYIDRIAVSVDGLEEEHDEIRGQKGAFRKMEEGLNILKERNVQFGLIHTVTPRNWKNLLKIDEWARKQGAKLLQIHPLEEVGRATEECAEMTFTEELLLKIYILTNVLRSQSCSDYFVQIDLLHRREILHNPKLIKYIERNTQLTVDNFAANMQSLVVNERGDVLPHVYGFNPRFKIGNIASLDFVNNLQTYLDGKGHFLEEFSRHCLNEVERSDKMIYAWSEHLHNQSYQFENWGAEV